MLFISSRHRYKAIKYSINLLLFTSCFLFAACHKHSSQKKITRSFYYWKSILRLSDFEKNTLDTLQVKNLYVKFFDVDWNIDKEEADPRAIVRIVDTTYLRTNKINIIPVVFITNECIQKLDSAHVNILATKISDLLKNILSINRIYKVSELQIDCDWSASTKDNYFALLRLIKSNSETITDDLSCTIRLHQVKYLFKSGIPPVDKGLLMCYNMGNIREPTTTNSILEINELKKYIGNLSTYPLPLDVAFPLFEWYVLFRNNRYKGLIEKLDLLDSGAIKEMNDRTFLLLKDTTINGIALKKDDIIRREWSDYNEIMKTADLITEKLKTQDINLSLFALDSVILSKHPTNELENIYNSLR
jgi:hypothetical protein